MSDEYERAEERFRQSVADAKARALSPWMLALLAACVALLAWDWLSP